MVVEYIIAAIFILFAGGFILFHEKGNKALKLTLLFVIAAIVYFFESREVRFVEVLLIIILSLQIRKVDYGNILRSNKWYLLFVAASIISLTYSDDPIRGLPGIAMYVSPLFFYVLVSWSINKTQDTDTFFKKISFSTLLLPIIILISIKFEMVSLYYGMAICLLPFTLLILTRKKIYLLYFVLCMLPAIVFAKRTPLLGIAAAIMVYTSLIYKWKAIVPNVVALSVAILMVLSIPQFRGRIFYGGEDMSIRDIAKSKDVSENINTSGRDVFWIYLLKNIYTESPCVGQGTGAVKSFIQSKKNVYKDSFLLVHNDWLLVLCEMGLVGVSLLLIFFIGVFRRCIKYSSSKYPKRMRLISATCAGSVICTMIHMFFENCMNSFIFPIFFIIYAIFDSSIKKMHAQAERIKLLIIMRKNVFMQSVNKQIKQ